MNLFFLRQFLAKIVNSQGTGPAQGRLGYR